MNSIKSVISLGDKYSYFVSSVLYCSLSCLVSINLILLTLLKSFLAARAKSATVDAGDFYTITSSTLLF